MFPVSNRVEGAQFLVWILFRCLRLYIILTQTIDYSSVVSPLSIFLLVLVFLPPHPNVYQHHNIFVLGLLLPLCSSLSSSSSSISSSSPSSPRCPTPRQPSSHSQLKQRPHLFLILASTKSWARRIFVAMSSDGIGRRVHLSRDGVTWDKPHCE